MFSSYVGPFCSIYMWWPFLLRFLLMGAFFTMWGGGGGGGVLLRFSSCGGPVSSLWGSCFIFMGVFFYLYGGLFYLMGGPSLDLPHPTKFCRCPIMGGGLFCGCLPLSPTTSGGGGGEQAWNYIIQHYIVDIRHPRTSDVSILLHNNLKFFSKQWQRNAIVAFAFKICNRRESLL